MIELKQFLFLYHLPEFILMFVLFLRMAKTNEEEWRYTYIDDAIKIGGLFGISIGAIIGIILFKWVGFYYGIIFGAAEGFVSVYMTILITRYNLGAEARQKKKEEKKKEQQRIENDKLKEQEEEIRKTERLLEQLKKKRKK